MNWLTWVLIMVLSAATLGALILACVVYVRGRNDVNEYGKRVLAMYNQVAKARVDVETERGRLAKARVDVETERGRNAGLLEEVAERGVTIDDLERQRTALLLELDDVRAQAAADLTKERKDLTYWRGECEKARAALQEQAAPPGRLRKPKSV